jgi:probable FeS assembly SUF system protein SufT
MNETNQSGGELELSREVEAIQIPSGDTFKLPAGTKVIITQSLGGTYTVATDQGLARISDKDSDALGIKEEKTDQPATEKVNSGVDVKGEDYEAAVWEQLRTVFDPEIPVNIVDLGLVYDRQVVEEEGKKQASVKMTLTAPGCGMGPTIAADAENKIRQISEIEAANVELVWDPPWTQDMISEEGKMKLGMI